MYNIYDGNRKAPLINVLAVIAGICIIIPVCHFLFFAAGILEGSPIIAEHVNALHFSGKLFIVGVIATVLWFVATLVYKATLRYEEILDLSREAPEKFTLNYLDTIERKYKLYNLLLLEPWLTDVADFVNQLFD